ncbi:MAG: peptide chain release factor N(5)-glutamine methyltransferase [Lachnospiraceae bacterium]|nr:peptide chain release factor N(5)-glutamine methyltransferase [Lachnospiraceae bacterium]
MIISDIYKNTVASFKAADIPEPENDARMMMEHILGVTRNDLLVHADKEIEQNIDCYNSAVERRCTREPLQYILGTASFMGLDFKVSPAVLVPRADTEILVEEILKDIHSGSHILDMCTGSGCILISLLNYSNECSGVGVDLSADALEIAKENAQTLIPDKEYCFINSDLFEGLDHNDRFDIIVSNPPYIASAVIEELMPEVRDHEPRMALDGTADGLYFYRKIVDNADVFLKSGGLLAFEIGYDQGEAVKQLMLDRGYNEVEIIKDYSDMDRVVKGIKAFHL